MQLWRYNLELSKLVHLIGHHRQHSSLLVTQSHFIRLGILPSIWSLNKQASQAQLLFSLAFPLKTHYLKIWNNSLYSPSKVAVWVKTSIFLPTFHFSVESPSHTHNFFFGPAPSLLIFSPPKFPNDNCQWDILSAGGYKLMSWFVLKLESCVFGKCSDNSGREFVWPSFPNLKLYDFSNYQSLGTSWTLRFYTMDERCQ